MSRIFIDPGHGGPRAPGAIGRGGTMEKTVNLAISLLLGEMLRTYQNIEVRLSRTGDTAISILERYNMSNRWNANWFVSIHQNSDGPTAVGIETLAFSKTSQGFRLAQAVQRSMIQATKERDRGVKIRPDLGVLRGTKAPAILVESGYISNLATEALLKTDQYQRVIAGAISDGIVSFAGLRR